MAGATPDTLRSDALAGLTNAAIVLPQGVAFALVAGLPPEYGLYSAMVLPVIAAVFGSSMIMVSGPTTAISAILFATLSAQAVPGTERYVQLALAMTIIVGVLQLIAGFARAGALFGFISHSVILGFTAAAALLIAASQIAPALGIDSKGGGVLERLASVAGELEAMDPLAGFLAALTLVSLVLLARLPRWVPAHLAALAIGTLAGVALDARGSGIAMFEALQSVTPEFAVPAVDLRTVATLAPGAATVAFIATLEAISIGRSFAVRRRETYDANREMVGQGLSNLLGGFLSAYAGSGSFTRSALNAESGARSPMSAIFAAFFLFLLLLAVAPMVAYIPVPVMAAIILYVAWRLVNFAELMHVVRGSRGDTAILAATIATGVVVDLEFAIVVGVVMSLFLFLRRSAVPLVATMAPATYNGRRSFRNAALYGIPRCPQIAVRRIEGPLFFGSVDHVEQRFREDELRDGLPRLTIFTLRGAGTVDLAGADFLIREIGLARARGGEFQLIATQQAVIDTLVRTHVVGVLGRENLFANKSEAVEAAVCKADASICRACEVRVFHECGDKPAPDGASPREHRIAELKNAARIAV